MSGKSPSDLFAGVHNRNLPESWLVMALAKEADYYFEQQGSNYTIVALVRAKELVDRLVCLMHHQESPTEVVR